jgi:hypothetical protein
VAQHLQYIRFYQSLELDPNPADAVPEKPKAVTPNTQLKSKRRPRFSKRLLYVQHHFYG